MNSWCHNCLCQCGYRFCFGGENAKLPPPGQAYVSEHTDWEQIVHLRCLLNNEFDTALGRILFMLLGIILMPLWVAFNTNFLFVSKKIIPRLFVPRLEDNPTIMTDGHNSEQYTAGFTK